MLLVTGTKAPDFTLTNAEGQSFSLGEEAKDLPVLLFFYPGDFTRICTREACAIRDGYAFFLNLGIKVIGVSVDSPETHLSFKTQNHLPFELLSDPGRKIARMYKCVWQLINRTKRVSYLLDTDHRILKITNSEFFADSHVTQMIQYMVENKLHQKWSKSSYSNIGY